MARPTKESYLQPVRIKAKKFDDALARIKEALTREPTKLIDVGVNIGSAQGLYVDFNEALIHYGFIENNDPRMSQIETALNAIEACLKEANVNIPLIGFNVGVASVSSDVLKESIGMTVPPTKATGK